MNVIWKYPLAQAQFQSVALPARARVLSVQWQDGQLILWAMHDKAQQDDLRERQIIIVGTGQDFHATDLAYVGTIQAGDFVWHVFATEQEPAA